ncbi:hypothetical protein HY449_02045 [Candidatus Pacearchaeota archaeon]|nr:hypothetical protein [Candidatus Pacearchaeota archaeon]
MKKEIALIFVCVLLASVISASLISADFFGSWFAKSTGNAVAAKCVDSDGGKDYYKKGTTSGIDAKTKKQTSQVDKCSNSKTLVEFFCDANNRVASASASCKKGCGSGACAEIAPAAAPSKKSSAAQTVDKSGSLMFTTTHSGIGDMYTYYLIYDNANYIIQSGDFLEYDIYCDPSNNDCTGGIEIEGIYPSAWVGRNLRLVDQNRLSNAYGNISMYASGKWYHRRINLSSAVGKTVKEVSVVEESDRDGKRDYYYRNIAITNGGILKVPFYKGKNVQSSALNYQSKASRYSVAAIGGSSFEIQKTCRQIITLTYQLSKSECSPGDIISDLQTHTQCDHYVNVPYGGKVCYSWRSYHNYNCIRNTQISCSANAACPAGTTEITSEYCGASIVAIGGEIGFTPSRIWISDDNSGWQKTRSTIFSSYPDGARISATGADWNIARQVSFWGKDNYLVGIKYKWVSGGSSLPDQLYYSTKSHGDSINFRQPFGKWETDGNWHVKILDMRTLAAGGNDWINGEITRLRFDFTENADTVMEIQYIAIGKYPNTSICAPANKCIGNSGEYCNDKNAIASVSSFQETCNDGRDDNCNGQVDEDCPSLEEDNPNDGGGE